MQNKLVYQTSTIEDGNLSYKWGAKEEVDRNRRDFLAKFSLIPEDCVVMEVEHAERITHVGESKKGKRVQTEAFITNKKGVVLFLLTADCFPIAFYDKEKEVIALAHLGWRPTNKKLVQKVVSELVSKYDSSPDRIEVFIGPGIHKESYSFKNPVQINLPEWQPFITTTLSGETQIDILGCIVRQFLESGVPEENISIDPTDTGVSEKYFSHYRATRTGESQGRFATIFALL